MRIKKANFQAITGAQEGEDGSTYNNCRDQYEKENVNGFGGTPEGNRPELTNRLNVGVGGRRKYSLVRLRRSKH